MPNGDGQGASAIRACVLGTVAFATAASLAAQASGRKPKGRSECRALFGGFRMLVAVVLGTN